MREQLFFTLLYQTPSLILGLVILNLKGWPYFRFILLLPGTALHELLHWVVALLTNGRPIHASLWPKRKDADSWTLGEVNITNLTWYNGLWISLAPILGIGMLLALTPNGQQWRYSERDLFQWLLSAPVWIMCWPSRVDWGVAFKSLKGVWIPIVLLLLLFLLLAITYRA
jgi:hypothetical protein